VISKSASEVKKKQAGRQTEKKETRVFSRRRENEIARVTDREKLSEGWTEEQ
jgi:hypothetical protein